MLGQNYRLAAQRALRELNVQTTPEDIEFLESQKDEYATPERAEGFGMVATVLVFPARMPFSR
jgi:hypothetical protein